MTVRPARLDDAAALGRIHIETWQVAYTGVFPEEFLEDLDVERRVEWFAMVIGEEREILVAESDEGIAGFAFYGAARGEEEGELYAIYVHPDHWGAGYGRDLLEATERGLEQSGFSRAHLWVLEPNDRARRFYERQGWLLSRSIKLEEIGGVRVTEVRYEKDLRGEP